MNLPFSVAALALAVPLANAPAPATAQEVVDERTALATVDARGRMIAAYDRLAWLATDDMQKRLPDWANRVGGWIVDGPVETPELVFYDRTGATPRGLYRARLVRGALVDPTLLDGAAAILSPDRLALIGARNAAVAAIGTARIRPCTTGFNTVVLPPTAPGAPTLVYFLSAQPAMDEMPIGGHYRVAVSADGTAGPPFAFSKGCMTLKRPPQATRIEAITVSTLTSPLPNETHVFSSESFRLPILVMVPGPPQRVFRVTPGRPTLPQR